jgi:anti-sigma factor RsiW
LTAVGAVAPWLLLHLAPGESRPGRLTVDGADLAAIDTMPLRTRDPEVLRSWLQAQTGVAFPVPAAVEGFELRGARITHVDGRPNAVLGYRAGADPVVLYLRPTLATVARPLEMQEGADGLTTLRWSAQGFDSAVLTPLPPARLGMMESLAGTP